MSFTWQVQSGDLRQVLHSPVVTPSSQNKAVAPQIPGSFKTNGQITKIQK